MIEVIAEIGVNHNGSYKTACELVDAAINCGCDAVKTQLWNTERVYPRERWDEMKALELSRDEISSIKTYCDGRGIEFICTPDEYDDAIFLKSIGIKRIKTSSQDATNYKFLKQVASLGLPIIYSTGACWIEELQRGLHCVQQNNNIVTVFHCVSAYPAPLAEMNLRMIQTIKLLTYTSNVGLSDHTLGNQAALVALGLGATIFEKHLTLDQDQKGPDHACSADLVQMHSYVSQLRACAVAMGDGLKRIMPCEVESRRKFIEFITPRLA